MAGFEGPIYLAVDASPRLARAVMLAHLLAGALAWLVLPPGSVRLVLAIVFPASAWWEWRRSRRRAADAVVAVLLTREDRWRLTLADGRVFDATPAAAPLVTPHIIALSLRCDDGVVRHLALLDDNAPASACRRLRVRLRLGAAAHTGQT